MNIFEHMVCHCSNESQTNSNNVILRRLRIQSLFFKVALFELQTPANDGNNPGDSDSQTDMYARAQKGGSMADTLGHLNFGFQCRT